MKKVCDICGKESGNYTESAVGTYILPKIECSDCIYARNEAREQELADNFKTFLENIPKDSDFDRLMIFLNKAGCGYEGFANDKGVWVEAREGMKRVGGYSCFYTSFEFGLNGNLKEIGAYE